LAHALPREMLDEDRTGDRVRGSAEMTAARAPLHLEDTTGERPPLHLDDSDDRHPRVGGRPRSPAPSGSPPPSVRSKPAAQPPIPPEPRSERGRKPTAGPPPSPPSPPSPPPPPILPPQPPPPAA